MKRIIDAEVTKRVHLTRGMVGFGGTFLVFSAILGLTVAGMVLFPAKWSPGISIDVAVFGPADTYTANNGGPISDFRIPALLHLPNDILLAFSEGREDVLSDWGNIDIVMKRSIDGGETWGSLRVLVENPQGRLTAGNMVPVYDSNESNVHLLYNWDNERVFHISSPDLGLNWTEPVELTLSLGLDGSWHGCGPGVGIQKRLAPHAGRLLIPAYGGGIGGSHVIYSDDGGITWNIGEGVGTGNEDQLFEAMNGSICLNMRHGRYRRIAWSHDGGETWGAWYEDTELPDVPCMAGVYRMTDNITYEKSRVLYCGTNHHVRAHYTIRLSYDEGLTWPVEKEIYPGPSAYGQLVVLSDNETVVLLVEAGKVDYRGTVHAVTFDLHWLTDGQDALVLRST